MVHYLKGLIDNMTPGWKSLWNTGVHGLFGRGGGGGGGGCTIGKEFLFIKLLF